jgi:TRAP-type mannitol/chloroaromatic compound transport system permease small subunit
METHQTLFRMEAIAEAQRRSRLAFVACLIVSLAVIFGVYNGYLSWYRGFAFKSQFEGNEVTKELQKELLKEWVSSRVVSIPLLGIKAGISDGTVLGILGLAVTSLWLFYSVRRENHTIALFLRDTLAESQEIKRLIFHGIVARMVFTTISDNDFPIESLKEEYRNREAPVMRFLLRCLLFLPFIAALLMLLIDVLSLFHVVGSPFRASGYLPWEPKEMIHAGLIEAFGLVLTVIIATICYRIIRFENATGRILREYFPTEYQNPSSGLRLNC